MDVLIYLFDSFMLLFDYDFTVFGFTFSFLDIFIFSFLVGIVGYAFGRLFGGD